MDTMQVKEQTGQKFFVDIEGTEYEWPQSTITTQQIRELGHIPADQQIIQESPDGTEHTLAENETIEIKPGHRIGRAPKYRRG